MRAEACHTLGVLGVNHDRVVRTLKEMIIFEEDDLVIRWDKPDLTSPYSYSSTEIFCVKGRCAGFWRSWDMTPT